MSNAWSGASRTSRCSLVQHRNDGAPVSRPVEVSTGGGVLRLTLNRPEARNALNPEAVRLLIDAVEGAAVSDDVRVVVIAAAGDHFCAGVDLLAANAPGGGKPRAGHIQRNLRYGAHRLVRSVWEVQLPVIAVVRGWASGLGCHLALASDYVVASRTARFAEPFVGRGFVPDTAGAFLLPRLVGLARAKEMLMFGRVVTGEEAAAWGMVNQAVDDDVLESAAEEVVARSATAATLATGFTKELVHRCLDRDFAAAVAEEGFIEELALRTDDFKEGLRAFMEKRPPEFRGR